MKIRPYLTTESTDSPLTNIKTNIISRKRTETEPTLKNEYLIPRSHEEYIHAQIELASSTVSKKKTVRFGQDLNSYKIRTSSFSQSKNNHKQNFDLESPILRTRLKSLADKYEYEDTIKQSPIGDQSIFGKKWDKRWQGMFETYRKIQEISKKEPPKIKINFENQFIISEYITSENLDYLRHQLTKPMDSRDNYNIDKILQKHKFFKRFPKVVRMGLLREGILREFDMNEMILSNTINNNFVYIILKGSCKIRAKAFTSYGEEIEFVSGSFYEGQHFGLSNLIQEQTVQNTIKMTNHELFNQSNYFSSSIYAQEHTTVLEIQERVFKTVLMQTIEKEIKQKLGQFVYINRVLKRVQMFQQIPQDQLIPLAAILQTETYKFGDTIIKQGQLIDKLYIVSSGQVKSVIATRNLREKINCFTNQDISDINLISKIGRSTKSYQNANRIIKGNYIEYTNHEDIQLYSTGDIFGTSSLLHDDEIVRVYKNNRYAQISMITVSSEAELFIIDQGSFDTLSELLQNHIKDHLRKRKEFDDVNSKKYQQDQEQWDIVKQAFYKSYAQIKQKQKLRGS